MCQLQLGTRPRTVLVVTKPDMKVIQDGIFGPVVAAIPFKELNPRMSGEGHSLSRIRCFVMSALATIPDHSKIDPILNLKQCLVM
jgi:hypothetical protein